MKTYKFTLIHKQYFDKEIEAENYEQASTIFNDMVFNDDIDWDNPDYLDSEQYYEQLTSKANHG